MIEISTQRIWTYRDEQIMPRDGQLVLDDPRDIISRVDSEGIIQVAEGLEKTDLAVFLKFAQPQAKVESPAIHDQPDPEVGYLVTKVDSDGSGIIVSGNLIESDPPLWVNDRLTGLWRFLYPDFSVDEFGLEVLHKYFVSQVFPKS